MALDISFIGFGDSEQEGFEQLFPFFEEDPVLLAPIQFTPLSSVRTALTLGKVTANVWLSAYS